MAVVGAAFNSSCEKITCKLLSPLVQNVKGVWAWFPHAVPAMTAAGGGQIVVTSSVLGLKSVAGMGAYCASKFAVQGLVGSLRAELAGSGVKAATVNPGAVNTPWWTEKSRGAKDSKPDIDFLEPEAVAHAILGVIEQHPSSDIDQVVLMPAVHNAAV
jgi:NADP-dependent 3-hydroxy acid dehydrogenase YdfG